MKLKKSILIVFAAVLFALAAVPGLAKNAAVGQAPTEFPTGGIMLWSALGVLLTVLIFVWHRACAKKPFNVQKQKSPDWYWVALILVCGLAARVALSLIFYGHKTDINCFVVWGRRVIEYGPSHFYDNWCDYPPGYMLVLGAMSWVYKLVGGGPAVNALLVKVPCIIADLAFGCLVYRYAKRTMRRSAALALLALTVFTPVIAFVSSAWGQIDQALTLALVIPILLLYKKHPIWAGLVYGLGIIMKPQALMCGPLFAAAYVLYVIFDCPYVQSNKKSSVGRRLLETAAAVACALAVIFIIATPFRGEQGPFWLIEKYYGTATSYEYATVNAYNFWALIGANWKKVDTAFMGLTYGKWGTIGMAFSIMVSIGLYVASVLKHKSCRGALPLTMAYMLAGIFTFGHYMHERYVFPALMLLMFAYIFYNDRRVLATYLAYAATMLVNCAAAFYYSKLFEYGLYWDERIIFWCSLANVVLFVWFTYVVFDLALRNKPIKAFNG